MANQPKLQNTQIGSAPTEEEKFYAQQGWEMLKNNLAFINEILRQLLTLNATLLAGSLLFLDEKRVGSIETKLIALSFFISLFISFLGILPFEGTIDIRKPTEVQKYIESALKLKRIFTWLASIVFTVACGIALGSFLVH